MEEFKKGISSNACMEEDCGCDQNQVKIQLIWFIIIIAVLSLKRILAVMLLCENNIFTCENC